MKTDTIRISAKCLGYLALPEYCPRCFWLKVRMKYKLPYQIFPGIFSTIDSYSKKITNFYFNRFGILPPWMNKGDNLKKPIKVPSINQFQYLDNNHNILLTGVPDEIIKNRDNTLTIIDYKTAKFTSHQDQLLPIYKVQLNGYKLIAEKIGLGKVSRLLLLYYEPHQILQTENINNYLMNEGFKIEFIAYNLEIEIDNIIISECLEKTRKIFNMRKPPDSNPDCIDCQTLRDLLVFNNT